MDITAGSEHKQGAREKGIRSMPFDFTLPIALSLDSSPKCSSVPSQPQVRTRQPSDRKEKGCYLSSPQSGHRIETLLHTDSPLRVTPG